MSAVSGISGIRLVLAVLFCSLGCGYCSTTLASQALASTGNTNNAVTMVFVNNNVGAVEITGFTAATTAASTAALFEVFYFTSAVTTTGSYMKVTNGWVKVFSSTLTTDASKVATISIPGGALVIPGASTYSLGIYSPTYMPTPNSATVVDVTGGGCIFRNGLFSFTMNA